MNQRCSKKTKEYERDVDRRYKGGRKGRGEDGNQNYTIYGREKKKKKKN